MANLGQVCMITFRPKIVVMGNDSTDGGLWGRSVVSEEVGENRREGGKWSSFDHRPPISVVDGPINCGADVYPHQFSTLVHTSGASTHHTFQVAYC